MINKRTITETLKVEDSAIQDPEGRNAIGQDADDLVAYWKSARLIGSLLGIILMANSLYIGYAMPVNVLSIINQDIGPSNNIYLISLVYTLLAGVLHLVVARVSDILGRRYFVIATQLIGVVGSIVCATATNIATIIGGSALTGISGAGSLLYPILTHELLPNKHRGLGQGAITLFTLPTLGFSPAIARSFVSGTQLGWKWCYRLNVVVSGVAVMLFLTCYFPPDFYLINKEMRRWDELKKLDYGGLGLYFSGLILIILGFSWAEGQRPWESAHVIASLVVGAVLLIAFGFYESYAPLNQPLLPIRLFEIRNF